MFLDSMFHFCHNSGEDFAILNDVHATLGVHEFFSYLITQYI